jgi:regulator of protease activity HflC (stomatin/prohibitin superfamily)
MAEAAITVAEAAAVEATAMEAALIAVAEAAAMAVVAMEAAARGKRSKRIADRSERYSVLLNRASVPGFEAAIPQPYKLRNHWIIGERRFQPNRLRAY